jgi:hypothetical protein
MTDQERIDKMRTVRFNGSLYEPESLAEQLMDVAVTCDSSMHEVASMVIRRLHRRVGMLEAAMSQIASEATQAMNMRS